MFHIVRPVFKRDRILKASMLEVMEQYPHAMYDAMYQEYSDGIICGTKLVVKENNELVITPGILKYKNELYVMDKPETFSCQANGKETILKAVFFNAEEQDDFLVSDAKLELSQDGTITENEMELGRFILKDGAILRNDYRDFRDFATIHNTINLLHIPYAYLYESTLPPEVTYQFGKEMFPTSGATETDKSFAMLCLEAKPMSHSLLTAYIKGNQMNAPENLSNEQIHTYLLRILENAKNSRGRMNTGRDMKRRMLVD